MTRSTFILIPGGNVIKGRVIGCTQGFWFVTPEDWTSDILVSAYQMRKVFDGDVVNIRVIGVDRQNRREG